MAADVCLIVSGLRPQKADEGTVWANFPVTLFMKDEWLRWKEGWAPPQQQFLADFWIIAKGLHMRSVAAVGGLLRFSAV